MIVALAAAPARLVVSGAPLFGSWRGGVTDASLDGLAPPFARGFLGRKQVEKKWLYTLVATPDLFFCLAIIDAGFLHSAFLSLFDRKSRTLLADKSVVLPGFLGRVKVGEQPSALYARIAAPGCNASIVRLGGASTEQQGNGVQVHALLGGVEAELRLESLDEPAAMSACADLGDGRFDFTQKRTGLTASGTIAHRGRTFRVECGRAGLDLTHGYLRRETSWRWAFGMGEATGRKLAFNFSEGFVSGGAENVLFLDGAPHAAGPIAFSFDPKDPGAPWHLRGDGLELEFTPEGHRAQNVSTPIASSRYVQPFGSFRGHLTHPSGERISLEGIPGVTEDHSARW